MVGTANPNGRIQLWVPWRSLLRPHFSSWCPPFTSPPDSFTVQVEPSSWIPEPQPFPVKLNSTSIAHPTFWGKRGTERVPGSSIRIQGGGRHPDGVKYKMALNRHRGDSGQFKTGTAGFLGFGPFGPATKFRRISTLVYRLKCVKLQFGPTGCEGVVAHWNDTQ